MRVLIPGICLLFSAANAQPGNAPPRPWYPCFPSDAVPGQGPALQIVANRVSGVAPLAVFFEAVVAPDSLRPRPFHDLAYCWDFGDSSSGHFTATGHSKNQARGAVAGHVFERPGVYTIKVRARDSTRMETGGSIQVSVQDPDSAFSGDRTTCFSTSGDFTGCPVGASQVSDSSINAALGPRVATGRRLLLRRGDTFSGSGMRINVPGPGTVGAFGSGAKPIILATGEVFPISDRVPNVSDWRIMDLDVRGRGNADASIATVAGRASHLLFLRVRGDSLGGGLHASSSIIDYWNANGYPGHDIVDGYTIQECELTDLVGGGGHNFSFIASRRFLFLGNRYWNSTGGEHVLRTPWIERGFLAANDLGGAPAPRHVVKMHAPKFAEAGVGMGKYTEKVILSDNVFRGDGGHQWTVAIGPQNDQFDERVRDVLVERNQFTSGPAVQMALLLWAQDVSVRNNLFDRGAFNICMEVGPRGIEPPPRRVVLANNTCRSTGPAPRLASLAATADQVSVFGNLLAGAQAGQMLAGGGAAAAISGNNLATTAAGFAATSPVAWWDFRPGTSSPALGAGSPAFARFWDFEGRERGGAGNPPEAGAFEFDPAAPVWNGRHRAAVGPGWSLVGGGLEIRWRDPVRPAWARLYDVRGTLRAATSSPGPYWRVMGMRPGVYLLRAREADGESLRRISVY